MPGVLIALFSLIKNLLLLFFYLFMFILAHAGTVTMTKCTLWMKFQNLKRKWEIPFFQHWICKGSFYSAINKGQQREKSICLRRNKIKSWSSPKTVSHHLYVSTFDSCPVVCVSPLRTWACTHSAPYCPCTLLPSLMSTAGSRLGPSCSRVSAQVRTFR